MLDRDTGTYHSVWIFWGAVLDQQKVVDMWAQQAIPLIASVLLKQIRSVSAPWRWLAGIVYGLVWATSSVSTNTEPGMCMNKTLCFGIVLLGAQIGWTAIGILSNIKEDKSDWFSLGDNCSLKAGWAIQFWSFYFCYISWNPVQSFDVSGMTLLDGLPAGLLTCVHSARELIVRVWSLPQG